jgi:uncharacterized protein YjiS (DUF1127 family)
MSTPRKPGPSVTWETIEKVADQGERTRLEALSEEDIDRELRDAGIEPEEAVKVVQRAVEEAGEKSSRAAGPAAPPLAQAPAANQKKRWSPGAIAAMGAVALAAGVLLVVAMQQPDGVAHGRPDDAATTQERAAKLREEAYEACDARAWAVCDGKLDEARSLDPAGESDPRVIAARKAIRDGVGGD